MIPSCSLTGVPIHFHSSTTPGTASLMRARIWPSILPRQSPSSLMRASIRCDGDAVFDGALFAAARFGATDFLTVGDLLFGDALFFMRVPDTTASDAAG